MNSTDLVVELKAFCRRRGARDDSVRRLMGPEIQQMCGVTPRDTPATIRRRLTVTVAQLMRAQGEELVVLLLTVLGLHQEAQQPTLEGRLSWLARQRFCGVRTVRRRADEAFVLLAEAAVAAAQTSAISSGAGYAVEALEIDVMFVGDRPHIVEERRIRVTDERLPTIRRTFGIPPPREEEDPKFEIEVVHGGRLRNVERKGDVLHYYVEPPQPLKRGDRHTFKVAYDFPAGQPMAHHLVIQPDIAFEYFAVKVRFDTRPVRTWRVDGVFGQQLKTFLPGMEELLPDGSGTVHASFHGFREGRCYGIVWAWE